MHGTCVCVCPDYTVRMLLRQLVTHISSHTFLGCCECLPWCPEQRGERDGSEMRERCTKAKMSYANQGPPSPSYYLPRVVVVIRSCTQPPTVYSKVESSVGTLHACFCTFGADLYMPSQILSTTISATEPSQRFIKNALIVGWVDKVGCHRVGLVSNKSCLKYMSDMYRRGKGHKCLVGHLTIRTYILNCVATALFQSRFSFVSFAKFDIGFVCDILHQVHPATVGTVYYLFFPCLSSFIDRYVSLYYVL